ncbi:MAG: amidohydrolase family protein [Phycisphaeraceae bacterium]|nr:amidohydrolase family protein [Phycisphaeraceae bacterium]
MRANASETGAVGAPRGGLREAHAHIAEHGRSLTMPSLAGCAGADDMLEIVRDLCRSVAPGGWLLLRGARVEGWAKPGAGPCGWPTREELDAASGGVACLAMSFDHHMVMANGAALDAGGIGPGTPDPPGGIIDRDGSGRATGLVLETAAWGLWGRSPEPTLAERRWHVASALADFHRLGFVEVHDMLSQPWLGPMLADLHDADRLPIHAWLYEPMEEAASRGGRERPWEREPGSSVGARGVRFAGGKIFIDGTLNSRTAWMLGPYRDPQPSLPTGKVVTDPAGIESALRACRSLGVGLAAHAIGDAAVRAALDAFEGAPGIPTPPRSSSGYVLCRAGSPVPALRIEHAEVVDAADVPRFARLGVVASVQPCHLLADVEALRRYLPHRLDDVLPLRGLTTHGCAAGGMLWFGSDAPIVRPDPVDSVRAATERRRAGESVGQAIAWNERIGEREAWACFGARP